VFAVGRGHADPRKFLRKAQRTVDDLLKYWEGTEGPAEPGKEQPQQMMLHVRVYPAADRQDEKTMQRMAGQITGVVASAVPQQLPDGSITNISSTLKIVSAQQAPEAFFEIALDFTAMPEFLRNVEQFKQDVAHVVKTHLGDFYGDDAIKAISVSVSAIDEPTMAIRKAKRKAQRTRWELFIHQAQVKITVTDRYDALGMAPPDPKTMCGGQCEGTGWVPVHGDDRDEPWRDLWLKAEKEEPTDDGWHFVACPDCGGTGKARRTAGRRLLAADEQIPLFQEKPIVDDFVRQYVETALWASDDDNGVSLIDNYGVEDVALDTLMKMAADCRDFRAAAANLLVSAEGKAHGYDIYESDSAYDFWLTRNRHGAGFWDRDLGEIGDKLTEIAHGFGEDDLYVGDDGKIHGSSARSAQRKDLIPGGKSDEADVQDFDPAQMAMGQAVEMEHTDDPQLAREIAMDHLKEFPDYYTRLKKMEDQAKSGQKIMLAQVNQYNMQQLVNMQVPPAQAAQYLGLNVPGTVMQVEEPGKYKVQVPGTGTSSGQVTDILAVDDTYSKPDADNYPKIQGPGGPNVPGNTVQPVAPVAPAPVI